MVWAAIFVPILIFIISAIAGYKIGTKKLKKSMIDKPYMNRKQIKAIFQAMGVQISEQNINMMEKNFTKTAEGIK
ncbi:MAG: hypothetical protein Ta2E_04920 [Mycoplasmoidaceae bacterium]|nr:MAG: hypothetical protein Ta2E_04920 [Mycoplasmoidaceae bacterium]